LEFSRLELVESFYNCVGAQLETWEWLRDFEFDGIPSFS